MRHVSSTPSPSFVDPSSLSLPSPPSEAASSPQSPAIDLSLVSTASTSSSIVPPRKRARTEVSPEEKREARAHRNRIAAQHSRDKRKAQFSQLEDKVRTLQQENDQLRAQLHQERQHRDSAEKDKENAELKERVKSLEEGWEAVLKALQSQGLPSAALPNPPKKDEPSQSPASPADDPTQLQHPSPTFPVFINTSPVLFPPSPLSVAPGIPQPFTGGDRRSYSGVPAAGGSVRRASIPALDVDLGLLSSTAAVHSTQDISETPTDEEGRIEDWFREVLASTDSGTVGDSITDAASSSSSLSATGPSSKQEAAPTDVISCEFTPGSMGADRDDMEMDRLLDLLPHTGDEFQSLLAFVMDGGEVSAAKDEEAWNLEHAQPSMTVV